MLLKNIIEELMNLVNILASNKIKRLVSSLYFQIKNTIKEIFK